MNRWELPEGWEWKTVGEIADSLRNGIYKPAEAYADDGVPVLRMYNIQDGVLSLHDLKRVRLSSAELDDFGLRGGDILVNRVNSVELVGKAALVTADLGALAFESKNIRLRLRSGILPELVNQWLRSRAVREHLSESIKATTGMASVDQGAISAIPIPLPPPEEQTRIVSRLSALQARITTARAGLDELRQLATALKRAVLDAAFRGDLTVAWREAHPDTEPASALLDRLRAERRRRWQEAHPGKPYKEVRTAARGEVADSTASALEEEMLPETWQMARLRDVVTLQAGYAFKSEWYTDAGVRLLRGINIIPGATRWDDVVHLGQMQSAEFEEYSLDAGDIVIAMDRPLVADGLKVARLAAEDLPALLLQRVGRFQRSSAIHGDFLFAYLHSSYFLHQVSGQATGTQLPHISGNDIEAAPVPIPPLEEQRQIGAQVHRMFQSIAALQHALNASYADLTTTEHALLAAAFRGELVPPAAP